MIKTLAASIRQFKKESILAPLLVTLEVVFDVIIPFLIAKMVDEGIKLGNMPYLFETGLWLVLCCLCSLTLGAFSSRFASIASTGFARNLRQDMFCSLQNFSFHNIDKFSSASLVTRLTTDVTYVKDAYQMIVRIAVRSPIMLVFSLGMAFVVNPRLALIFLAIIPVLGGGLYAIIRYVHPIFVRVFDTYDELNKVVQENVRGIRVVKSYVREKHEISKFQKISNKIARDFMRAEKILTFNSPLVQFCSYAGILLISWIGARLIVGGNMSEGELLTMFAYAMQILLSLMMLSMVFVMIIIARTSAERIVEVLREQSDLVSPENPVTEMENGDILFQNVTFSYPGATGRYALKNIDLTIRSGETIGIVGGTGSAKSSLVQLIPRLYDVTEGAVLVGGKDVRSYGLHALRNGVAMVLQKNELFSGTIADNLRWGDENATQEELEKACRIAQAHGFIMEKPEGYETWVEQGGTNVSGGQKQRLCIARALLKKPKILIFDDSTSAVDTKTDAQLQKAMREDLPGTTKIIIAQRISSISHADKIVVMEAGCIVATGTHEELLKTSDIYKEVYESQNKGGAANEE